MKTDQKGSSYMDDVKMRGRCFAIVICKATKSSANKTKPDNRRLETIPSIEDNIVTRGWRRRNLRSLCVCAQKRDLWQQARPLLCHNICIVYFIQCSGLMRSSSMLLCYLDNVCTFYFVECLGLVFSSKNAQMFRCQI